MIAAVRAVIAGKDKKYDPLTHDLPSTCVSPDNAKYLSRA
jgi:hypothetical protein